MDNESDQTGDDLIVIVEQTDDESAVRLTVTSGTGRPITIDEFYLEVEAYIHSLSRAQQERETSSVH